MNVRLFGDGNGYRLSFAAPGETNTTCYMSPDEARQARDELLKAIPLTHDEMRAIWDRKLADNGFTVVDDPWKDADFVKGKYDEAVAKNKPLQEKIERLQAALTAAIG